MAYNIGSQSAPYGAPGLRERNLGAPRAIRLLIKILTSKTAYTVLDSLQMFAQRTIRSEDLFFFFREHLGFGRKIGKSEMKSK